jgi:hypothetical protein
MIEPIDYFNNGVEPPKLLRNADLAEVVGRELDRQLLHTD